MIKNGVVKAARSKYGIDGPTGGDQLAADLADHLWAEDIGAAND